MKSANITSNPDGSYSISHINQYGTNVNVPLSNIPGFTELGINPNDPSFHSYVVDVTFANSTSYGLSSFQDAFEALAEAPAPVAYNANGYVSGDSAYVGPGRVIFSVNPFDGNVTNITIPGEHLLNPGIVFQQAFETPDGRIGIETIGLGNGPLKAINVSLSLFFGLQTMLVLHIKWRLMLSEFRA